VPVVFVEDLAFQKTVLQSVNDLTFYATIETQFDLANKITTFGIQIA
jgi:hypothetical protein